MNIKTVKLRGFIGIKKGLGLDEISLDLSGVSGLIALAGPNGHGKTTLLDNMHPFPILGSREKALSHHVFLRDSFRDLTFDHDGIEYRTLIKIDSESDKTEGFIWADGESLVEGKITAYKKKIAEVFGSQTLFFNSVFCAQNAPKLSGMRTGLLRDLFAEFLKLDELQEKHLTAKQCKNIMIGKVADKDIQLAKLQEKLNDFVSMDGDIDRLNLEIEVDRREMSHFKNNLGQSEILIDQLKEKLQADEVNRVKLQGLKDELAADDKRYSEDRDRMNKDLDALRDKAKTLNAETKDASGILEEKEVILAAEKSIEDNRPIVKRYADIISGLESDIDTSRKALNVLKDDRSKLSSELSNIENNKRVVELEIDINYYKKSTEELEKRDDSCQSETCPFIKSALDALEQIPGLEQELASLQQSIKYEIERLSKEIESKDYAIELIVKDIKDLDDELQDSKKIKVRTENDIIDKVTLANKKPALDLAEKTIHAKQEELKVNYSEGISLNDDIAKLTNDRADSKLKQLESIEEIQAKISDTTPEKVKQYESDITFKKSTLESKMTAIHKKEAELISLQEKAKGLQDTKEELKTIQNEKDALSKEVEEWAWLTTALSKDRLQALEIAGAAPTITGYANQLLSSAFGPQTMVKLQTQDENGKEVLKILVIDEDGNEVELSMRSGGQQVWALKALRLAMAMLSKEKSGRNFKTILTDEEDGALDSEKAVMFIHLYRAFMEHGGFDSCFYISHKPECVDMADHVLEFSKGGIEIS